MTSELAFGFGTGKNAGFDQMTGLHGALLAAEEHALGDGDHLVGLFRRQIARVEHCSAGSTYPKRRSGGPGLCRSRCRNDAFCTSERTRLRFCWARATAGSLRSGLISRVSRNAGGAGAGAGSGGRRALGEGHTRRQAMPEKPPIALEERERDLKAETTLTSIVR